MNRLFRFFLLFSFVGFSLFGGVESASAVTFRRPLDTVLSPPISYYYDNNPSRSAQRYTCSTSSVYNNHRGTDFRGTIGTNIYAGASGGLYYRTDGCPTWGYLGSSCGGGFGNHVRIDHEGVTYDGRGWVTIYAHMQSGTPAWYQSLYCGTYIGKIGSSGSSTGPHLHFEVRKYGYPYDDPFAGACSGPINFWTSVSPSGLPGTMCGS